MRQLCRAPARASAGSCAGRVDGSWRLVRFAGSTGFLLPGTEACSDVGPEPISHRVLEQETHDPPWPQAPSGGDHRQSVSEHRRLPDCDFDSCGCFGPCTVAAACRPLLQAIQQMLASSAGLESRAGCQAQSMVPAVGSDLALHQILPLAAASLAQAHAVLEKSLALQTLQGAARISLATRVRP